MLAYKDPPAASMTTDLYYQPYYIDDNGEEYECHKMFCPTQNGVEYCGQLEEDLDAPLLSGTILEIETEYIEEIVINGEVVTADIHSRGGLLSEIHSRGGITDLDDVVVK
ncbi:MAG: hypothetical protein AABX37_03890, partial [Nanoarchaeota archaeon]